MKKFFKPKEKFSLGLDIGTQSVKFVKLKFNNKEPVELYGLDLEPCGLDFGEALKKIKESQGIDSVNISVSGPSTVIRHVNFPRMSRNDLRQALKFEAQKHIPFPVNEINLDGFILKEDLPDNKMLVLIAAVKKEFVNQRLKAIEDAGIKVNLIDVDSLAICNSFNFNYSWEDNPKYKSVGLLNIGSSISNLDIIENGMPRLSRDIHIAGNNFTQKLTEVFNIDFKSAEELKINPDAERAKSIAAAIETVFGNLANNIRTSFDYYESQSTNSVAKIFLSGGGAKFTGCKDMLANLLGIEIEYWDPLRKIKLSKDIDVAKAHAISSQLVVCVGLALRQ
jgi:type IV pilus assembly protein PilM